MGLGRLVIRARIFYKILETELKPKELSLPKHIIWLFQITKMYQDFNFEEMLFVYEILKMHVYIGISHRAQIKCEIILNSLVQLFLSKMTQNLNSNMIKKPSWLSTEKC